MADEPASRAEASTNFVFVSYATSDRREALAICEAIERRGTKCWISCRDVRPGENYQEAIVRAIRRAQAMILVFSDRANNSDEIKKELSLVSRFHVPLIALRTEDVEPGDAFAYELATRQWIDLFEDWDKSMDAVVRRVAELAPAVAPTASVAAVELPRAISSRHAPPTAVRTPHARWIAGVTALAVLIVVALAGTAYLLRSPSAHGPVATVVRLADFKSLPGAPSGLAGALHDDIIAALGTDGVVNVSTAPAPPAGDAPAFALAGAVSRDGDRIRIFLQLTDERSGTALWSHNFTDDAASLSSIARRVTDQAATVVRCGLFGASTYPKQLPDSILADYLQSCHEQVIGEDATRELYFARKVAGAAPDFSWGWSGLVIADVDAVFSNVGGSVSALRREGQDAAAKATALDPTNSEAPAYQSYLIDESDLLGRDALFRKAIAARPLACGCEHHLYGNFLEEVGRSQDAIAQFRLGVDASALNANTQFELAFALAMAGQLDEARKHIDATVDLLGDPKLRNSFTVGTAAISHDYAAAIAAVPQTRTPVSQAVANAWRAAFGALQSGNAAETQKAVVELVALPVKDDGAIMTSVGLLGALGADQQALALIDKASAAGVYGVRAFLFLPTLSGARTDPKFPALLHRLGLIEYWRATGTRPDLCRQTHAAAFCRVI